MSESLKIYFQYIYSVDEAASASMGTRKATQAFSSSSKIKLPAQDKYTIAEIPPFSSIKESVVRDKLRSGFISAL